MVLRWRLCRNCAAFVTAYFYGSPRGHAGIPIVNPGLRSTRVARHRSPGATVFRQLRGSKNQAIPNHASGPGEVIGPRRSLRR
jgi:hypothetical protein